MNKKFLILLISILLLSGCAIQLKDKDGKIVKKDTTGQVLIQNIICSPDNEDTLELYRKVYKEKKESLEHQLENREINQKTYDKEMEKITDVDELDKCREFQLSTGKYQGIWTSLFVKPLAWLLLKIGVLIKSYGLSIIIITLLIRLIMYPVTRKTALQSENMNKAKPELEKIEKKYKGKNDNDSMVKKNQETMMTYKKYNINPISGCLFAFIQIPLFFAFYEALSRTPAIFEGTFLKIFELGTSPSKALLQGKFYYIILVILVIAVTYYSFKLNKATAVGSKEQEKQMAMMTNMMIVFISIATFSISTAIAIYWIFNSGFTVLQNLLVKRSKKHD